MRTMRWIEVFSGLAAGILGLLILTSLLFGPTSQFSQGNPPCPLVFYPISCSAPRPAHLTSGTIQIDLFPWSIFDLGVLAWLLAVIPVSAALHSRSGHVSWLACLWTASLLFVSLLLLSLPSLALELSPALALAVVTSGVAWIVARKQVEWEDQRRRVARWMEAVGGGAASLLGMVASAYLLTAPVRVGGPISRCDLHEGCVTESISTSGLLADPVGTLLLGSLSLAFFGLLAISAICHSRTGATVWRDWIWGLSLVLVVFSVLGSSTNLQTFLPSAWLSLLASLNCLGTAYAARMRTHGGNTNNPP
jgi:hypothetical protein